MESVVTLWLAASALVDVIITVALVWHLVRGLPVYVFETSMTLLYQRKHRTGIPSTDDIVNRIIRGETSTSSPLNFYTHHNYSSVTVQTGMLTAIIATIDLVLFLTCVSNTRVFNPFQLRGSAHRPISVSAPAHSRLT